VARDAFAVVGPEIRRALEPAVARLAEMLGSREEIDMVGEAHLESWSKLMAIYREAEGWASHRDWINEYHPKLSPNAEMRMKLGARISSEQLAEAVPARDRMRERMNDLLHDDTVLALPAAPDVAPVRGGSLEAVWALVQKNGKINSAAALAGLPQISCPVGAIDGMPIGLGLIAGRGGDEILLKIADQLERLQREP
jgi:amidase